MIPVVADGFPLVYAHRGGGEEATENTRNAFQRMSELGIRHIETDVQLTQDGYVVIHHDDTVDRNYDGTGRVRDLYWDELRHMTTSDGQHMMLLSEALQEFPDLWLNIDAKTDEVVEPLLEILHDHNAYHRVMLASFSERRLKKIRRLARGRVSTSLGVSAAMRLLAAAQTATSPGIWHIPGPHLGVRAVQVPHYHGPVPVVTPRFVAAAHTLGLAVHVWTVNEPAQMSELLDMRVDGLITDRPTVAKDILMRRGIWRDMPPADSYM